MEGSLSPSRYSQASRSPQNGLAFLLVHDRTCRFEENPYRTTAPTSRSTSKQHQRCRRGASTRCPPPLWRSTEKRVSATINRSGPCRPRSNTRSETTSPHPPVLTHLLPTPPPPALPRTKPAAAPSTLRTDGLTLVQASFNLTMGFLDVRERNQVAECSAKSAIDVTSLYEAARNGGGKVFDDEESLNYFDLSDVKLTEAQLEQLMSGQLVPSGRWCEPTGITFAGFSPAGVDLSRELPGFLADALSRLVVLRGGVRGEGWQAQGMVAGPLAALVPRLPVDRIRVLDLARCNGVTGQL